MDARDRKEYIGSHDIGAIAALYANLLARDRGTEPPRIKLYSTAGDVWASKLGLKEESDGDAGPLWAGRVLEAPILERWAADNNVTLTDHQRHYRHPAHDFLGGTIDARSDTFVVDAKASGMFPDPEDWGEPGTDFIPWGLNIQGQWFTMLTGLPVCYFACLFAARNWEIRTYQVKADKRLQDRLVEIGVDFWTRYVLTREPPPECERAWVGERFKPTNPNLLAAGQNHHELAAALKAAKDKAKHADGEVERYLNQLAAECRDNEGIEGVCTFKPNKNGVRSLRLTGNYK